MVGLRDCLDVTLSSTSYRLCLAAAVTSLPAAVLVTAWLVGDLSYRGPVDPQSPDLDYAYRALPLPAGLYTMAGIVGLLVLVPAASIAARRPGFGPVLTCLVGAGVLTGFTYRVMTAGVIGANIGAGLAVIIGGPLLLALLVTGTALAVRSRSA